MNYTDFFKRATRTEKQPDGLKPFPYQCRLAEKHGLNCWTFQPAS